MSAEVLIELGELQAGSAVDTEPAVDTGRRPARRVPRWLLPVVVGLAVLLTAGGSTVPRPGLVPLYTLPYPVAATATFGTESVFTYQADGVVSAYDLTSGAHRWTARTPASGGVWMVEAEGAGVLLLTIGSEASAALALDVRTGRQLWRFDNTSIGPYLPDRGLAVLYNVGPIEASATRGVEIRTGRTVWSQASPGSSAIFSDAWGGHAGRARVVNQYEDGTVEVIDAGTGTDLARSRLPGIPPPGPNPDLGATLSVAGDQLLVAYDQGRQIRAFTLDTLAAQWSATLPQSGYGAQACGALLCFYGAQGLTGVDASTGAVRWHTQQWPDARPLAGDRLLVQGGGDMVRDAAIVGAADLRPVLTLGRWSAVDSELAPSGPVVVSRDVRPLTTWFAVVDPRGRQPVLRVLGSTDDALSENCLTDREYLACPTVHNELHVWRYRW